MFADSMMVRPGMIGNRQERRRSVAQARAQKVKRAHGGGQAEPRKRPSRSHLRSWDRADEIYTERLSDGDTRTSVLWSVYRSPSMLEMGKR